MFDRDPSIFALRGRGRVDVFLRFEDISQNRARFRCIGMFKGTDDTAPFIDFEPHVGRDIVLLTASIQHQLVNPILTQAFSLCDVSTWPKATNAGDPLELFLYLEFFRAWQVGDLAVNQLISKLTRDPVRYTPKPGEVGATLAPIFDYNRMETGVAIAKLMEPVLRLRVNSVGFRDDKAGSTGYGLRMLGDLCLRADDPTLALACFETCIKAGDNPFRRRKAIEAAAAAQSTDRLAAHVQDYQAKWKLPADLSHLANERAQ